MAPLKETCGSDGNVVGSTARRFRQLKYDDRYDNDKDEEENGTSNHKDDGDNDDDNYS